MRARPIEGRKVRDPQQDFLDDQDNSILFESFGGVFATVLPRPIHSRDPVCEHIFQPHFRDFREKSPHRKDSIIARSE
jgi:hypothetical protein